MVYDIPVLPKYQFYPDGSYAMIFPSEIEIEVPEPDIPDEDEDDYDDYDDEDDEEDDDEIGEPVP